MSRIAAIFLLLPQLLAAQTANTNLPPQPREISLQEAVQMAWSNSPQAVTATGTLRNARITSSAARLAFLPNLNVSASSTWQRGQRIGQTGSLIDFTGPSKSFNDGINLSMELFDGGRRFFDVAAARASVDAADAGVTATRFLIAQQVKEQYYNVLAAREEISAAQAQIAEAEQQLRTSAAKLQAGAAIRSDSLRSVVLLGNAQLALIDAETRLFDANSALTRAIASPYPVTAGPAPPDEPLPDLTTERLQQLLNAAPAMEQARSELRSSSAAVKSARSAYLPTINMTYGRNGSGFDSRYGFGGQYAYASSFRLNLSLPIFNQLQREQTAVRALVAVDEAEAGMRDTELRLHQELTQALGQLRSGQKRIEVQQASVRAAQEDLSIQQQRYALNASSLLDVTQSQTQLTSARSGLIAARYDFRVARARLEALLGRSLDEL